MQMISRQHWSIKKKQNAVFKPSLCTVLNHSCSLDPSGTKQCTSNNKGALKYKDDRTQLPASFSDSAVITWAGIIVPCPVPVPSPPPVCVCVCVMWQRVRCPKTTGCFWKIQSGWVEGRRGTGVSMGTEDGCDQLTNYRECIMCLSSGSKRLRALTPGQIC